ncbi:MAG: ABC transporter substrate-binding protein [Eubacteriales bacterium]|nr:ABC transporter substrate-binding protein [Eubacteriales bacterium]
MKLMKKVAALAMATTMIVASLAGCGGSSDKGGSSEAADTFKIGAIGPITGGAAVYGQAVKNGAEMAINEINEAGGINGFQVEYNFQDDEHDAEKSVNAYNTLKDWGMQLLLGTVTSAPCIAVSQETANDNMMQITPSATAVESIAPENAFRVCFSDPNQGIVSAQYINDTNMAKKVAVIYDSSDPYSSGIYQKFAETAASCNFEIVAAEAFTADNRTDFSVQLQKAKDAGADLVFMPFYYTEASLVLKQAAGMDFHPTFFGVDGMDGILDVENFDASLAEGLVFLAPFCSTSTDETIKTFVDNYKEKYGEVPNQFAADAYDGIYILKQAMEAAEVTPDMSVSDICEAVKAQMTQITYAGVTSKEMTWGADGEPVKAPMVLKIHDGAYTEME